MPNRVIKESIWTSPNLNNLPGPLTAEILFYRLLLAVDDFGCCECTTRVIKGKCFPLKDYTTEDIEKRLEELESANLLYRWENGARQYCIFPTLGRHQRLRSFHQRKTPEPPESIVSACQQALADDDACQQALASRACGRDPNPNPNPNPNIYARFETFWEAYPKKKSKGQAEKTFRKIKPDEQLLATMLAIIERAKKSDDWLKESGKYIPYPATWLNARGWEDEYKKSDYETYRKPRQVEDIEPKEYLKKYGKMKRVEQDVNVAE